MAFLFTEGVEQVELTDPLEAVRNAGAQTELISLESGEVQMWQHFDKGDTITADRAVADADPSDYDALVLPGGVANPDQLRVDSDAVRRARGFFARGSEGPFWSLGSQWSPRFSKLCLSAAYATRWARCSSPYSSVAASWALARAASAAR